ncbi:MAG: TIM barrel protein [Candidatus Aenigmatarchaeota archaeon]
MLIRKKSLKIQERLGMKMGVTYGVSTIPVAKNVDQALEVMRELYKVGFRALVLPPELFSKIGDMTALYKDYYGDLLRMKNVAKKLGIELSLRRTTFNDSPDNSLRIFSTIASVMDCRIFVISPDFYPRMPQNQALRLVVHKISEIVSELRVNAKIGVETAGKTGELGSIEDVIEICKRTKNTEPAINWAHIHARGAGSLRSVEDYKNVIEKVRQGLGNQWLHDAYFFFSGIKYDLSGEIEHKSFVHADIKLEHMIRAALSYGMGGTIIFEEPEREAQIVDMLDRLGDMVR